MPSVQVQENDTPILGSAVVARDFTYVDWSQVDATLQTAFSFLSSIRVEKAQIWATAQVALKNGSIQANSPVPSLPIIDGAIANVEALDSKGSAVGWNQASSIAYTIVAQASVTIPKAAVAAAVTTAAGPLGGLAALALLPSNLPINIGHTAVNVPITRDGNGRITKIGTSSRP